MDQPVDAVIRVLGLIRCGRSSGVQDQHAVEDVDSECHFGGLTLVGLRAQRMTDDRFQRAISASTRHAKLYPDASANSCGHVRQSCRCRFTRSGAVSAVSLGTPLERGGTMTAASG